ncbi:hypothetical protein EDD16DRAFT_1524174 [Pisolithus croceorrhizus]|nr:hypothetical protein EDD16DRAFT_1524174 [Pisolithus croceorrhizus]KAI6150145.1 hypothetical protein EDD17DRAFT_1853593 [Pisolithus thermaeus]
MPTPWTPRPTLGPDSVESLPMHYEPSTSCSAGRSQIIMDTGTRELRSHYRLLHRASPHPPHELFDDGEADAFTSPRPQSSLSPQTPAIFVAIPAVVVVTIGLAISVIFCIASRRHRQQTDVYFLTSLSDGRRRWLREPRHQRQHSPQSEAPTSHVQAPASSSVDEASRKRPEPSIIPAGTHTPPVISAASSSSPLPEAETVVKQAERYEEKTQLKGEELSTQSVLTPPPAAHVVCTRRNVPAPTEQIGCASGSTCDTVT